jgi:hypothetical protein
MAIAEVLTGSYDDEGTIRSFFELLTNLRPAWHAQAACRAGDPTRGTHPRTNSPPPR